MPRPYSEKFLLGLQQADANRLGVRLGRLCVEANLPAAYVAKAMEISRISIYHWFRGKGISEDKRSTVEVFMDLVTEDMKRGILPAKGNVDAKLYIQSMIGTKFD